jgi:DNA-binding GntR family transcriptional regulator
MQSLVQITYDKIKEMMLNYEIIPGQRLILIDLAKQLGVSRTPVNIALSILTRDGFLDFMPNQGYRVHEITPRETENLYDIREMLELGAIEKAIDRLSPEAVKQLKEKKLLYEKAVAEQVSRGRFYIDQEFHACLIDMAGNPYLTDYFREIYQRIFLRHRIEGLRADRAKKVVIEHDELYDAVSKKDIKKAKKMIREHIKMGKEYIISSVFR